MIITAMLLSDLCRTLVFSIFSVLLTYGMRNNSIKKRIVTSCIYIACVTAGFAWVFAFISIWNEAPDMEILFWGVEWTCFYLLLTIIQHLIYHFFGKGQDIQLLALNSIVILILCFVVTKCFIKV